MNWNRMVIGLAVAALVGLVASIFVYRQVRRATAPKPMMTLQVVVAAMPLPLGARLQDQNLRTMAWPADSPLPPGVFTRKTDCLDRALVSSVVENEPILEAKLAPKEGGAGLSVTIPEGMRGVSVQVNEVIAVAGFVLPGSMVDVLVTGSTGGQGTNNITKTILEDIRVLAAGQQIEQDKEGKPHTVPVITLLVTPEDANKLTMGANEGKIQLALRNTIDTKKENPPPVFQATLFGGVPAPTRPSKQPKGAPPAPPVAAPYVVEVIRGGKRETSTFTNP
jgi:pilus assembly protein CpaB